MRLSIEATLDYHLPERVDVLLCVEAIPAADQRLEKDLLTVGGAGPLRPIEGGAGLGQRTWMTAEGDFLARYSAVVEVERSAPGLESLTAVHPRDLPAETMAFIFPSRYCEADRFEPFVEREFGHLAGGAKVVAMAGWINANIAYVAGSSVSATTAADSFVSRQGVCRDYAHLLISFARAAGIPARMVSAYAWKLEPQDFHAVVEVWLDNGWHLVDATGMAPIEGLVRIAVGRDATDISFMTIFGFAELRKQWVNVTRMDD